jgi:hypothetical protein
MEATVAGASNKEILLQEVPDHFFDAEGWARLVTSKGSREKALSHVSVREPAIITHTRRQAIEAGSERAWEARQEEDLFLLVNFLASQFNARLMSGELIATGILKGSTLDRTRIPAEIWDELRPDFEHGVAQSPNFHFLRVRVATAPVPTIHDPTDARLNRIRRCVEWLRERRLAKGDEPKKILDDVARKEVVSDLTVREFNTAYGTVYGRQAGRPRGNKT